MNISSFSRNRMLVIMRIAFIKIVLLFLSGSFLYANNSSGQEYLDRKISLQENNITLKAVLNKIEKAASVKFSYSRSLVNLRQEVSFSANSERLSELLDRLFKPLSIEYDPTETQILLFNNKGEKATTDSSKASVLEATTSLTQAITIKGKVFSAGNNLPLPGASVLEKGTPNGTSTDANGNFSIDVASENAVLVISSVGYTPKEIVAGKGIILTITLETEVKSSEEVIVVGYGSQRRRDVTGSIAKVTGDVIRSTPVNSPDQALQGRVAGVQVVQSSGAPGGAVQVRIRGVNSTAGGGANQPLYVVDGVPLLYVEGINSLSIGNEGSTGGTASNGASPLNTISPNDIESMEILKDASATAIYGSRAANGVVLITTKTGRISKPQISVNVSYGVQSLRKKIPVTNARERVAYTFEHRRNAGTRGNEVYDIWSVNPFLFPAGTDWQDETFRNAPIANYNLGISGGSERVTYSVSGDYLNHQGIVLNTYSKRTGTRVNVDLKATDKLKFGTRTSLSYQTENQAATDEYFQSNLNFLNTLSPLLPVYDASGNFMGRPNSVIASGFFGDGGGNVVANVTERTRRADRYRMISNMYGEYTFIPGLKFKSSLGIDYLASELRDVSPTWVRGVDINSPLRLSEQRNTTYNWVAEQTLTYDKRLGDHLINAVAGFSAQNIRIKTFFGAASGALSNALDQISNNPTIAALAGGLSDQGLVSQFIRSNYSFQDKYLLTATLRRDGSSRFGSNNQYGLFPSASVGWRLSNENFLKNNTVISNLMIRASYGVTGNQNIGNFLYTALMGSTTSVFGNTYTPGLAPNRFQNEDIQWERNQQADIGVDVSFFQGRLNVTMDYYDKRTKGLLAGAPLSVISGIGNSYTTNIGEIKNSGFEFDLNSNVINNKNFTWNVNFNISTNKNEVVSLGEQPFINGSDVARTTFINRTQPGHPIGGFYIIDYNGQYQTWAQAAAAPVYAGQPYFAPGDLIPVDQNKDNIIDVRDRIWYGSPFPDYFGGITNTFTWKQLSLSIFAPFQHGNKIWNQPFLNATTFEGNTWRSIYDNRWLPQNAGTTTSIPVARNNNPILPSSLYLQDGSFFRIRTIALAYQLPLNGKKTPFTQVRLYAQANNFFVFTKYQGWDPEVNSFGSSVTTNGIDIGGYPQAKSLVIGANIGF